MADSQVPWNLEALQGEVSKPAWKEKPSWYLATEDRMIPVDGTKRSLRPQRRSGAAFAIDS